ncbi:cyclodehydratase [Micromonospora sp. WMMA1363]|uniref:cyclodehydratase n=1 Tax=Micromonospora sp. WMMA1363 TaxID=3053985 RepID=UPI00259CD3FD|nr:cyclodehydratase [Micromonospora sp. WMMA1363]MDM4719309.1 cyclodehydratase [Micromonospora sp. WMMA1363]
MSPTSRRLRVLVAAAAAVAISMVSASPVSADDTAVDFACQARPPIVPAQTFGLSAGVDATAPATVASGSSFTVALAPAPLTVPGSVGGYTVREIRDLKLSIPVPANATLTGQHLSGGSGLGSAPPTVGVANGRVVVTVPGPISGGSTFTPPTLTLAMTAGASGTTVETRVAGDSYGNPGLTFTARVPILFFTANVPTSCYPSPSPVLSSTTVV